MSDITEEMIEKAAHAFCKAANDNLGVTSFEDFWSLVLTDHVRNEYRTYAVLALGAALAGRTVDEYAVQMSGGGMHVRVSDPQVERIYPLADWLKHSSRNGTRVYCRRTVVVEDWHEVASGSSESGDPSHE
jgi:hypothetical protein